MSDAIAIDPQRAAEDKDVRPIVATGAASNWGLYAFLALLLIGGMALFNALSASREAPEVPSVLQPVDRGQRQISSPEPLRVPERFAENLPVERQPAPERAELDPVERAAPIAQPIALPPTPAPPIALPIPIRPTPVPAQPQVVFESRIP
ncbi:hypothetical protein ACI5KX_14920, partial [Erythrobacter sp. GH1-10]